MSGEFLIAQAVGLYERDSDQEKLKIPGPIKHDITVNVSKAYPQTHVDHIAVISFRFLCEVKRIPVSSMSTHWLQTLPLKTVSHGNWVTGQHVRQLVVVANNVASPLAFKRTKVPWTKKTAGQMQITHDLVK